MADNSIVQLEKVVNEMSTTSGRIATGTFGAEGRPWLNFEKLQKVGQFDYEGLHQLFDRKPANDEYAKAISSAAARKLAQVAKLAADYLAGMERDMRMRRRTRIRMFVHGGNRAAANGQDNGPLKVHSIGWLSRISGEEKKG